MAVRPTGRAIRVLFDQYVTPLLTELGFNRQQRVYRHHTSNGDSVIIDFQVSSATSRERYQFYINLGLALRTLVEETRGLPPGAELTSIKASECVIGTRLQRPGAGWPNDPDIAATALRQLNAGRIHPLLQQGDPTRWSIDTEQSAHIVGLQLVDLLPPLITEFTDLLDHDYFANQLRHEAPLPGYGSRDAALVGLLVDTGMTDELDTLLLQVPDIANDFVAWARHRAATADTRHHGT